MPMRSRSYELRITGQSETAHERQTGRLTFRFLFAYYAIEG